jgi:hypothetical protein
MKFWHKVEAAFKKLFGTTTWEKTTSSVLTYLGPLVVTLIGLAGGPAAAAAAAAILATVQNDLATLSAVVEGATATPAPNELATAKNALASIRTNLPQLLDLAEVKNSANASKITSVVNTVISEVDAIAENIPATA